MVMCWLSIILSKLEVNGSNPFANNFFLIPLKPYVALPLTPKVVFVLWLFAESKIAFSIQLVSTCFYF